MRIRLAENFRAVFYAPFYATNALGFYAREGVDVELICSSGPGEGVAGLLNATVDITWGGPMRVMKAREQQSTPLACFCEVVARDPFYLVGRRNHASFELPISRVCGLPLSRKCRRRGCACSTICASTASIRTGCRVHRRRPWPTISRRCASDSLT